MRSCDSSFFIMLVLFQFEFQFPYQYLSRHCPLRLLVLSLSLLPCQVRTVFHLCPMRRALIRSWWFLCLISNRVPLPLAVRFVLLDSPDSLAALWSGLSLSPHLPLSRSQPL